jgi:hypothetical protein
MTALPAWSCFDVGRIKGQPLVGLSDRSHDIASTIEMHQIQNATQMGYRFHGLSAQFEMKLPGLFTECIARIHGVGFSDFQPLATHTLAS